MKVDTEKTRRCAPLLPPPGGGVVRDLCDEIDRQRGTMEKLHAICREYLRKLRNTNNPRALTLTNELADIREEDHQ